jgi:Glycosyltransferase family 9 (heptosyltransferase)
MILKYLVKAWRKLDPDISTYPRLLWNVWIRRRQIVIVDFQGSLGDLVCFCASLPGLRKRHAPCWIILVTHRDYLELVRSTGLVDVATARYGFFHLFAQKFCPADRYYTPTDVPPTATSAKLVNPPIHTAVHFAQLLGVEPRMDEVYLRPRPGLQSRLRRRLAKINPEGMPILAIHVGPTWAVKEWPYWEELGQRIEKNLRLRMVQVGTEASSSPLHNHAVPRVPGAIDWVNRLSIMETVALLEQSQIFLGIDSGPLHLATTVGIPTIGLFGPVIGQLRAHPRAPFTCLTANVPCLGCHHDPAGELHWRTGCPYDIRCMKQISVEDVFNAVESILKSRSAV